jgi:hypothetical protein
MAFNFLLEICLYLHSFELFNCGHGTPYTSVHSCVRDTADAGEREVNLLETWDTKPFA